MEVVTMVDIMVDTPSPIMVVIMAIPLTTEIAIGAQVATATAMPLTMKDIEERIIISVAQVVGWGNMLHLPR